MSGPRSLTTDRLRATRVELDDEPFVVTMWQDSDVTATLGGSRDAPQVARLLARWVDHWDRRGFGTYVLRDRADDRPVGWIGLGETDVGGEGGVELLYAIATERWREGLASEAGAAMVACAFSPAVGLDELVGFTLPENVGSRRVLERLGFEYEAEVEHAGLPHVLYRLRHG